MKKKKGRQKWFHKTIKDHDHGKYITILEFSRLMLETFAARLKQANLPSKNDISEFIYISNSEKKYRKVSNKNIIKSRAR